MALSTEYIQALYELSMSIGSSLDLKTMTKHALAVYLRKLNCRAGIIYQTHGNTEATLEFQNVCSIPRNFEQNNCDTSTQAELRQFVLNHQATEPGDFHATAETSQGLALSFFDLPGFGVLVLANNHEFDDYLIKSLEQVNTKLAHAAISCVQNAALATNESKYRNIFESIQDVYAEIDPETGTILEISPSVLGLSGYTREELLGDNIVSHYKNPDDRFALIELLKAEGNANDFLIDMIHKGGQTRNVSFNVHLSPDADGRRMLFLGTMRDVTQRQVTAQKLRQQYDYESHVAAISSEFAQASLDQLDSAITSTIERISAFVKADHSYFHRYPHSGKIMIQSHQWWSPELRDRLSPNFARLGELLPWLSDRVNAGELVNIPDVANSESLSEAEKSQLLEYNIHALIAVGIISGDDEFGVLFLDASEARNTWTKTEVSMIRFASEVIASSLSRNKHYTLVRLNQERLELAIGGASLGTWDWNIVSERVDFNERWAEMLGYEGQEILPHISSWMERIHPNDISRVEQELRLHMDGQTEVFSTEHRVQTLDGNWRWLLIHGQVVERNHNDLPIRMVGIFSDETERVVREREIRNNEQRLNTILRSLPVGIILSEPEDDRLVQVNPAALSMLGVDEQAVSSLTLNKVLPPEESEKTQARDQAVNRDLYRPDGLQLPIMCSQVAIEVSERKFMLHSFVDISTHIEAERTLKANLKIKNNFVSNVSHELRTPLASILGFAGTIMRDENMPDEVKMDFIRIIYEESQRLTRLIENVLDISKMESGAVTLRKQSLLLNEVVTSVVESQQVVAGEKGVALNYEDGQDLPSIYASRDSMNQVILNLISNAIKFTDSGGSVSVELSKNDEHVILKVSDTGIGIPEEDLNKVFEKFYRVENESREDPGTGIGLAIVKETIDQHGGRIKVESVQGQGSTFTVKLPIEQ